MHFHLLHAGTLIGVADLRPEAPAASRVGASGDVTLVGTLAPTDAYAEVRPLLQQLVQTAAAADPRSAAAESGPRGPVASLTDVLHVLWQVATLPLALARSDGTAVTTRQILVLDAGAMGAPESGERAPVVTAVVPAEEARGLGTA